MCFYSFSLYFCRSWLCTILRMEKVDVKMCIYGMESSANMSSLFKNLCLSFEVWHTISKYLAEIQMWWNAVIFLWGFRWSCLELGLPIHLFCHHGAAQLYYWIDALWQSKAIFISFLHRIEKLQLIYCRNVMDFQPSPPELDISHNTI